jgi:hypothetical protein
MCNRALKFDYLYFDTPCILSGCDNSVSRTVPDWYSNHYSGVREQVETQYSMCTLSFKIKYMKYKFLEAIQITTEVRTRSTIAHTKNRLLSAISPIMIPA